MALGWMQIERMMRLMSVEEHRDRNNSEMVSLKAATA